MKLTRSLSAVIFYLTRVIALLYLATALHTLIAILFHTPSLTLLPHNRFSIAYPFTQITFLIGDAYTPFYIFELVAFMALYGLFFWTLGNIFLTFRQRKLFTPGGIFRLRLFYWLNFTIPPIFLVIHIILSYEVLTLVSLTVLHFALGVFAYFMAAIFSQGLNLQNEQDLIF